MKQDEIIEMAKESNLLGVIDCFHYTGRQSWVEEATAFAKLVAAKEREAWPAEMEAMERQVEILSDELSKAKSATRKETLEEMIYAHPTTAIEKAVAYEREGLVRIIEANIAAEREACAKVCDEASKAGSNVAYVLAQAIRARGK